MGGNMTMGQPPDGMGGNMTYGQPPSGLDSNMTMGQPPDGMGGNMTYGQPLTAWEQHDLRSAALRTGWQYDDGQPPDGWAVT